jgi:hypothetical protein
LNELLGAKPVIWPLALWMKQQPDLSLLGESVRANDGVGALGIAAICEAFEANNSSQSEVSDLRLLSQLVTDVCNGEAIAHWLHEAGREYINLLAGRINLQHASITDLYLSRLELLAIYRTGSQQHLEGAPDIAGFVCILQKVGEDHLAPNA